MSDFLIDTLVWTGALLALVLLIRRPVASIFGPKAAYALWALPMARLLLPPLVLPAWMAPATAPAGGMAVDRAATVAGGASAAPISEGPIGLANAGIAPEPALFEVLGGIDWTAILLPIWLAGAALFLVRRYALYFEMRRDLLAQARPMGEAGRVRLVETPAADGPVAFGVLDQVIALPMGFMSGHDRGARDLALKHELAHHHGHDLMCNMLVQPLFALHWFNPLSLLGWRALRRDQEAACDARVIDHAPRETRAAYAAVIARFAVQPRHAARLALAAPMACPVLGDRSIVQRLKSLAMTDVSARRRWSGRLLITAGALALPLTGSISYAQDDAAAAPAAPVPIVPSSVLAAPAPPAPPEAPSAPIDGDGNRVVRMSSMVGDGADGEAMTARESAEFDAEMKDYARDMADYRRDLADHARDQRDHASDMADFHRDMAEMQRDLAREQGEIQREVHMAIASAHADARAAIASAPRVTMACRDGQKDVAQTVMKGGRETIYICNRLAMAEARSAVAEARADLARSRQDVRGAHGMSAADRARALRALDAADQGLRAAEAN